jgi:hypothetical protein
MFRPYFHDQQQSFVLPIDPLRCLHLFTPEGKRLWADEWDPSYHNRVDSTNLRETVFTVRDGGSYTIWRVVHHDAGKLIRYHRLDPGLGGSLLDIACLPLHRGSLVKLRFRALGFNDDGNDYFWRTTGPTFEDVAENWRRCIVDRLSGGSLI